MDSAPYRNAQTAQMLARKIAEASAGRPMTFMEVCGTHTMAIARYGLRELLPPEIKLISGPGCPVCVTPNDYLDHAIALSGERDRVIVTFGDMLRVPGSSQSLESARTQGADVRVVTSTIEAVAMAETHPQKEIVFLGVGFETTAPTVAAAIIDAKTRGLKNFSVLTAHKTMPMPLRALSGDHLGVNGYILPGHVSAIIGTAPYAFLPEDYGLGGVVSGFEPVDILDSIRHLAVQVQQQRAEIENQYSRVVRPEGNAAAIRLINTVFKPVDARWRGLGEIAQSGLAISAEYADYDAALKFEVQVSDFKEPEGCRCGEILKGRIEPPACGLYGTRCTPEHPVGACMVSSEGTCAAHYRFLSRMDDDRH